MGGAEAEGERIIFFFFKDRRKSNLITYAQGIHINMKASKDRQNEVYMLLQTEEKRVGGWGFKGKEGNLQEKQRINAWEANICWGHSKTLGHRENF